MQRYRHRLLSTTYLTLALGSGVLLLAPAVVGGAGADLGGLAYAACNPCNPCAAAANPCNPCNPCAAIKIANPCNPCAVANPCAAASPCSPCNPCAAKSN
jgi:hypothetical protein